MRVLKGINNSLCQASLKELNCVARMLSNEYAEEPATSSSSSRSIPKFLKPCTTASISDWERANIRVSSTLTRQMQVKETKRHGSVSQDSKPRDFNFDDKLLK
jgi:hypothetical protein